MKNRRKFLTILTTGFVALSFVVGSTFADELIGVLTKVDVEGKKVTVVDKDDKDTIVTVTEDTEYVREKGKGKGKGKTTGKIELDKVEKDLEKAKEKGRKGIDVTVTHEKGTASKIVAKKKAASKDE